MSGVYLPTSAPPSSGWQLADWQPAVLVSDPAAGGIATATGDQLDSDELWLISRSVTSCTSTAASTCRLYASTVAPRFFLDGTLSGNFDVAEYPRGLQLYPGQFLVAQWTGADPGAVGTLSLQVEVYRRVTG